MSGDRWPRGATIVAIVALGLGLYLPGLGAEILRHPLEAKYALAAREMLHGGPLLVARLFGALYPDKPPLYFWATAGLGWLEGGRITEVTARLPAVVAALGGLVLAFRLGADLFGARTATLSAAVLGTSGLFFWYARQGHPDQMLTTWVTLACLGLWRLTTADPGARRIGWTLVAYGAMALAVMSKGLLGLVLPVFAGTAYAAVTGPWRRVPARIRLGPGLLAFLAVLLGWYGPAVLQNGWGYLYETIVHQHLVRYAHTWVHKGPWYYYVGEFTAGFFPWSLFVPGAIALGWRARREAAVGETPGPSPFLFPLSWFATGFVFFSLSTSKRGAYLLPLYPAAALMVGWLWDRVLERRNGTRWIGAPLALLGGVAGLLGVLVAVLPRRMIPGRMVDTMVPAEPGQTAAVVALLLVGSAAVWWSWRRGRPGVTLAVLVAVQSLALLAVTIVRAPQYEARFPVRELAARVAQATPPGRPVLSLLGDYDFIVAFYLDRPLTPVPDAAALRAAQGADGPQYALVDDDDRALLGEPGVQAVAEGRLGPKRIIVIRLSPR